MGPVLEKGLDLPGLQKYVARMVAYRGFNEDLHKEFILLSEEIGELAKEIRRIWEQEGKLVRDKVDKERAAIEALGSRKKHVGHELADCMLYLLSISNMLCVDIESAIIEKEEINSKREW